MLKIFFTILMLQSGLLILPGSDFAIVMRHSIVNGRKGGLICMLGIVSGVTFHLTWVLLIGEIIYQKYYLCYLMLISCGVLYLYYLSWHLLKNAVKTFTNNKHIQVLPIVNTNNSPYLHGLITNVSNIKVVLTFIALLPLIYKLNTILTILAVLYIPLSSAIWFFIVVYVFSINKVRNLFLAHLHWIELVVGLVIIIFATDMFYHFLFLYFFPAGL
jgi:threonine/homoserine/homoserine lactone efflux protein